MEKKWTRNAPISEIDDKRSITATFSITMENKFLPMQLIYKGKTSQSLPKIHFPNGFSLSANLKHYSNETESLKFLKDIILSYVKTERERLGLETQPALLIYDVFWRQTTDKFLDVLKDNILSTKIPPNMTHVFQTLDLTVNKFAKDFMKGMFSTWFSRHISRNWKWRGTRRHRSWPSSFSSQTIARKMACWIIISHIHRWGERNCCQWLEKSGHLRHYQTWFKRFSIFGSICRYMPSDRISPVTWKPEFIDPLSRRAWLSSLENPVKWG